VSFSGVHLPGRVDRLVLFACAVTLAAAAFVGSPAGAAAVTWPATLQITSTPALQTGGVDPTLNSTACWSSGSCVSVGEDDASGGEHPIVVTEVDGVAAPAVVVAVPAGALTGTSAIANLNSVSCSSAGACFAVGEYEDTAGIIHGLVVPISGGKVGTAVGVTPPGASGETYLRSVSCPLVGVCVAVGTYAINANANQEGAILTIANGVPSPVSTVGLPANANTNAPLVTVNSVSCWATGYCVAAGQYLSSSGAEIYPFVIPVANGVAAAGVEVTLPATAYTGAGGQQSVLNSISCQATGACVAAGEYVGAGGGSEPLVVPISAAGKPAAAGVVSLPANAGATTADDGLNAVSCGPTGACEAVGYYVDSAGSGEPLAVSVSGSVVSAGTELKLPGNALGVSAGTQAASLSAVACPQSNACLAVGDYDDFSSNQQGLVEPVPAGTSTPNEPSLPAGVVPNPDAALDAVACATSGSCLAVGSYLDATAQTQAAQYSLQAGLAVANASLPGAYFGTAYSQTLTASGAWNTYTWSLASGRLPAGLRLNAQTGKITGKPPRTASTVKFTVRATATGSPAQSVTKALSIKVIVDPVLSSPLPRRGLKLSGKTVSVPLSCAKGAACKGTLKLVYAHTVKVKHRPSLSETAVIGSLNYSLGAGKSRTEKITLTAAGLSFEKAVRNHKLAVAFNVSLKSGTSSTRNTTVIGPPTKKKKKPSRRKRHSAPPA
jgi:hypothetical protein